MSKHQSVVLSIQDLAQSLKKELDAALKRFEPGFMIKKGWKQELAQAVQEYEEQGDEPLFKNRLEQLRRALVNLQEGFCRGSLRFFRNKMNQLELQLDEDLASRWNSHLEKLRLHMACSTGFDLDAAGKLYVRAWILLDEVPGEQERRDQMRAQKAREEARKTRHAENERKREEHRKRDLGKRRETAANLREEFGLKAVTASTR